MIILLNPTSARWGHRFPLSLMHLGAVLEGKYPYQIMDQNLDKEVEASIEAAAMAGNVKYLGITVMPGPQLMRAIPFSRRMKQRFPGVTIVWGGYFPTLHARAVLRSGYADYVVRGAGDRAFLSLIDILEGNSRTGLGDVGDGEELRRLPGGSGQGRHAALERGHPLLEDVGGRVHDPGIDVPELLQGEEIGGVLGVLEDE